MNQSAVSDKPQTKSLEKRKADLESQLEEEERISRRQELLKKIYKIEKQQRKTSNQGKSYSHS